MKAVLSDFPDDPVNAESLADMYLDLSLLLSERGRASESFEAERKAMEVLEELQQTHPHWKDLRSSITRAYNNLGLHLLEAGRFEEAEQALLEGQKSNQSLVDDFPTIPRYRLWLAINHRNLGMVLFRTNRPEPAERVSRRAVEILERLQNDHPETLEYQGNHVVYLDEIAEELKRLGRPAEAEQSLAQALERARRIAAENRTDTRCLQLLARVLNSSALLLFDRGVRLEEVPPLLEEALVQQRRAVELEPEATNYLRNLRSYLSLLSETNLRLGDHRGASAAAGELAEVFRSDPLSLTRAAELRARCVIAAGADQALDDETRQQLSIEYTEHALDLLEQAARIILSNPAELTGNPAFNSIRNEPRFQALIARLTEKTPQEGD